MQEELNRIIQQQDITTVFQPIFNVERKTIVGYEALTRGPADSRFASPETLFSTATEYGLLSELEILCRNNAIRCFAEQQLTGKLFLNVSPMILLSPNHPQGLTAKIVEAAGLSCEQIVIELSEKYPIPSTNLLNQALAKYRQFGFEVAIDDLGSGYAGLKQWSYLRPDIVKIDRYFIADCHQDIIKREFLRTIFELGHSTNAQVIAEGIESEAEFELLQELGMIYAQGYFLAKPAPDPVKSFPSLTVTLKPNLVGHSLGTVNSVIAKAPTVSSDHCADQIYQLFIQQPRLQCIPVLQANRPIGLIYREQLMEYFSDIYGRSLLANKSVTQLMDDAPLIINKDTRLEDASIYLTQLNDHEFSRFFIVESDGYYLGLGSLRELLRRITAAKIENARYANPLTLLPGNVPIDREIDYLLAQQIAFDLAYLDLNHFKPFNDVYGYAKGDLILKQLARIIQDEATKVDGFVGHVGGDDFVILFTQGDSEAVCQTILTEFEQQIRLFFDEQHLAEQGYHAVSRNGEPVFYPLVSLAIGLVTPNVSRCHSHNDVAALAADAKRESKRYAGHNLFVCRRQQPQSHSWPRNQHAVA